MLAYLGTNATHVDDGIVAVPVESVRSRELSCAGEVMFALVARISNVDAKERDLGARDLNSERFAVQ